MSAFVVRRSRIVVLSKYILAIVIYTVVIVYINRCHELKESSVASSFKSDAWTREDRAVDNKIKFLDEMQQPDARPLSKSNSSLANNSRDNDDNNNNDNNNNDDDDNYREREGTIGGELTRRQPTTDPAVRSTLSLPRNNGTIPKVVRLLCWLLTDPSILKLSTDARDTWMQACDVRLFMSSKEDKEFPTIGLNVSEGRKHIAEKSKAAWTYIYENHYNDAEFFVKADPDSYVVVENLKRYLANCNPDEPAIYGHNLFYNRSGMHYVAGEAIVLGREALNRLVTKGIPTGKCFVSGQSEDLKTCACLAKVGGYTVDTRDANGRETFLPPFSLEHITKGVLPDWYAKLYRKPYGFCQSIDCLSHHPIAFHYINRQQFYLMNYLYRNHLHLQSSATDRHSQLRFNGTRYYFDQGSSP